MATATALRSFVRGIVGPKLPPDVRLHAALESMDAKITSATPLKDVLTTLDRTKKRLYKALQNSAAPLIAKALTIKIQNLFLSKYHFLTRATKTLSSPYGIIVDPMNACQL
ncbi:MAG: hypothetical protein M3O20_03745, partial [Acidobacteriota bacterium]|nr:hypothetical protein [Acidobacteriota bacterium]